jgi:transcriptional regulator with XRE-family HTH domain
MNQINSSIGERLRDERERLGLSQEAFAQTFQVSTRTLYTWERGSQFPNAEVLSLASALGVDVLYVLTSKRSVPIESTLSEEEQALLDNYKHADDEGRAAARRVLSSLAQSNVTRRTA